MAFWATARRGVLIGRVEARWLAVGRGMRPWRQFVSSHGVVPLPKGLRLGQGTSRRSARFAPSWRSLPTWVAILGLNGEIANLRGSEGRQQRGCGLWSTSFLGCTALRRNERMLDISLRQVFELVRPVRSFALSPCQALPARGVAR